MNTKPIYTASSFYEFLRVIFFCSLLIIGFFLLLLVYNENPVVIFILLITDVLFFLTMEYRQISIYEDRIVIKRISIFSTIFNSKGAIYYFKDLREAELPKPESIKELIAEALVIGLVSLISKRSNTTDDERLSFYLELKDGKSIPVYTRFGNYEVKKVVDLINLQIEEGKWKQF